MAQVNLAADVDGVSVEMRPPQRGSQEMKLTEFSERSKFGIRTQMEKILLVVAGILLILCIVFIALLAKESSSDDDSSSSSSSGRLASLCSNEPCVNNGTCREHNDDITCTCASGFTGKRCEARTEGSLCAIQPCVNNGTCHEKGDDITCTCASGFTGKRCEAKIKGSLCAIQPCVNNGTCHEKGDDITCTCASGFTGKRCEAKIKGSLCAIQPCVNNGTCHEKGDDITCTCASGFTGKRCEAKIKDNTTNEYVYSDEAQRIKLPEFLKRVQDTYYEYNRNSLPWRPHEEDDEFVEDLKNRHLPYNATPAYLKVKTDAAFKLLNEINSTVLDENKMTPREVKALEQVKHFLRTVFGSPFDENFYNGDWMLGPNHFCWQAICSIAFDINAYVSHMMPKNFDDAEKMIEKILLNKQSITQYKANMQLGVKTGMVRSKFNCITGIDAFKQEFKKISSDNDPTEVLSEWFVQRYIKAEFTKSLSNEDRYKWMTKYNKTFMQSVNDSLIEGIGQPIVDLINYMEKVHIRHCLPRDVASGIAELPVEFIYVDGKRTNNRTTRRLPITGEILDGKKSYKNILPYFTTSEITPERVNEIGHQRLKALYPQIIEIAKNVTKISNETEAVAAFRKILTNQSSYYNDAPFPQIESNATAHKRCTDLKKARKYCPERYKSLLRWISTCRETMSMLSPKLIPLFYHTGDKITFPNCPIQMLPSFNPSSGAQFFQSTGADCTKPARFGLPFFLENHGPRFSEWSVTAHESWPGHHTQVQAQIEYFKDKYGGVPKWIDDLTYYTFFTEGWGLYSENPVIAKDTDTYKEQPMQKFGMLKWQVWRALRLIVDTGLHYRGMNRTEALWYFSHYAWDDSDLARKEITRYQGVPGQATAYMLGQQRLVQLREYAKTQLNNTFNIQDFHYQILSQGSAPEVYLAKHVEKYVKCSLGTLKGPTCDVILKPPKKSNSQTVQKEGPPKPPRRHYY